MCVGGWLARPALKALPPPCFNNWGVGKSGLDNGVLVLIAFDDRAIRIEVGAGLSDRLPDGHARKIVGGVMVPAFKTVLTGTGC